MSVPVGRRKQSRFEAQHQFYRLRDEVTKLTMNQFGFSYEKYNDQIEQAYKSWMGAYTPLMSKKQIKNMKELFKELFGKEPRWKK